MTTTGHKDDCHCGSGKRYKHCHLAADQAAAAKKRTIALAVVGALVVGVAAWGMVGQWKAGHPGSGVADSLRTGGAGTAAGGAGDVSGATAPIGGGAFGGLVPARNDQAPVVPGGATTGAALAPGEHPTPWQYEVAKNRHYDPRPGHQHWHEGPPPADTTQGGSITPTVTTVGGTGVSASTVTTTTTSTPVPANFRADLAPGEHPGPWEFDAKNNRHYNPLPEHKHWHPGPPPPPSAR